MANIVVIESDPRVLRQIKQYLGELGGDEHKVRYFDSQELFEARYFNAANQKVEKSPLQEFPFLSDWTTIQVDWLLERKLEADSPYTGDKLSLNLISSTLKINNTNPELEEGHLVFGMTKDQLMTSPNTVAKLIATPFQPVFKDTLQQAIKGEAISKTFPIASDDTGRFWLITIHFQPNGEAVVLKLENQTPTVKQVFDEEVAKKSDAAIEDGVELDLLGSIDLIIFKLNLIGNFKKGWLKQTRQKIEKFGFRPQLRPTKFMLMKYEDDGVKKVDLLLPQLNDIIYLPVDRVLFLQKVDIILAQPELIQPKFLFQQDTEMKINLSKRTMIEHISDVGIGVRNPMALRNGLLGHFFFRFPGEEVEHEIYGKVQKSIPHPEIEKQFIVYFTFAAIAKETLTDIRRFLSKNPRYSNLKSEDRTEFSFNPDNIFLTDEERRIKNVAVVTPDSLALQQTTKTILENFDQINAVGTSSYTEFLKNNFTNASNPKGKIDSSKNSKDDDQPEQKTDLSKVKPTTESDLGKTGMVVFFVNKDSLNIEAPMPPEDETESVLDHKAIKLQAHNRDWVSLLFPQDAEQDVLVEAVEAAGKGRHIKKSFVCFDGNREPRLITIAMEKSGGADDSIKIELTPADAKELKQKILLETKISTLDALVIDSHFIPEDIKAWVEGLTNLCQQHNMLPADKKLKIIVIGIDDVVLRPPTYAHPNLRAVLQAPLDTRALLLNISLATNNEFTIYNFDNMSWLDSRMPVHIAKPVTLLQISEFGGAVGSNSKIANGTFLFLRGNIYDHAPNKNLCVQFYCNEDSDDGNYKYKCHMLYFGINESFMKFARSWFRETYAASKQKDS